MDGNNAKWFTYGHLNVLTWLDTKVDWIRLYLSTKYNFKHVLQKSIIHNHSAITNWLFNKVSHNTFPLIDYDDWSLCVEKNYLDVLKVMISNSEYIPSMQLLKLSETHNNPDMYTYFKQIYAW